MRVDSKSSLDDIYEEGRKAGIKEVVDWVENNYQPSFAGGRGTMSFYMRIDKDLWRAQRKEWGFD